MENGVQALMLAFAVLVFVIALTVTFSAFANAKQTADVVLFVSDREKFQTPLRDDPENVSEGGRTVGIDTVISTISRCVKEKFTVKIIEGTKEYKFEYDTAKEEEIKQKTMEFIKEHTGKTYRETYVEVTTSGHVVEGEDGTSLGQDVGTKLYITYEKKS